MKMVKFKFYDVMPPDLINISTRGIYCGDSKTIHISKKGDWITVLHEIGHYIIDIITPQKFTYWMQTGYDKNTSIFYDIIGRNSNA